jgi:hypothetical protein
MRLAAARGSVIEMIVKLPMLVALSCATAGRGLAMCGA